MDLFKIKSLALKDCVKFVWEMVRQASYNIEGPAENIGITLKGSKEKKSFGLYFKFNV